MMHYHHRQHRHIVTTLDLSSRHGNFHFYDSNHVDMIVRFSLDVDMIVDCCDNCLAIGLQWLEHLGVGRIMMLQWVLEHFDLNNEIYELIRECNVNNYHNINRYL